MNAIAVIIAGALIAGAIAFTNHWALVAQHNENSTLILRLNRWTGSVVECVDLVPQGANVSVVVCPYQ
jgi:hypothetical protein